MAVYSADRVGCQSDNSSIYSRPCREPEQTMSLRPCQYQRTGINHGAHRACAPPTVRGLIRATRSAFVPKVGRPSFLSITDAASCRRDNNVRFIVAIYIHRGESTVTIRAGRTRRPRLPSARARAENRTSFATATTNNEARRVYVRCEKRRRRTITTTTPFFSRFDPDTSCDEVGE